MSGLQKFLLAVGITVGVAFLAVCALVLIVIGLCSLDRWHLP